MSATLYPPSTRDTSHEQARAARECADWQLWLKMEGKRARTREDYLRSVARVLRDNPYKPFSEYTPSDLLRALSKHPQGSQRPVRAHYQSFFKWGVHMGLLDRNPMDRVPHIQGQKQRVPDIFNEIEIPLLEGGARSDGLCVSIMLHTGIRRSECIALRRKHIDLDRNRELIVYDGKGGKDRIIPFGTHLAQVIADYEFLEPLSPDDHLWWMRPGGGQRVDRSHAMTPASFQRWWERVVADAGVPYRNAHTTRHTFATRWLRRGGSMKILQQIMGHSSIQTTLDLYGHLDQTDARAELNRMEAREAVWLAEQLEAEV